MTESRWNHQQKRRALIQVKMLPREPRYGGGMLTETIQHFYNEDREHLEQLLVEFNRAKVDDLDEARRIFGEFREGLDQHIGWEEEILFPIFERLAGETDCGTGLMRAEHQSIRALLLRIERMLDGEDARLAAEEVVLREILSPHCATEELMLYPMLDELLTDGERSAIFARMRATPHAPGLAAAI